MNDYETGEVRKCEGCGQYHNRCIEVHYTKQMKMPSGRIYPVRAVAHLCRECRTHIDDE